MTVEHNPSEAIPYRVVERRMTQSDQSEAGRHSTIRKLGALHCDSLIAGHMSITISRAQQDDPVSVRAYGLFQGLEQPTGPPRSAPRDDRRSPVREALGLAAVDGIRQ